MKFVQIFTSITSALALRVPEAAGDENTRKVDGQSKTDWSTFYVGCAIVAAGLYLCLRDLNTSITLTGAEFNTEIDISGVSEDEKAPIFEQLRNSDNIEEIGIPKSVELTTFKVAGKPGSGSSSRIVTGKDKADSQIIGLCVLGIGAALIYCAM